MDPALSWARSVPDGSSLLVVGDPMTGKRGLATRLVAADRDPATAGTVLVTTRQEADDAAADYRAVHPLAEDRVAVVDCASRDRGLDVADGPTRRYAYDPGDLTGIGIGLTEFLRRFDADGAVESVRVGLGTLSTVLMYADLRRVFQFVHVATARVAAAGHVGVFVADDRFETGNLNLLVEPFDGVVEVRVGPDGTREHRVRALGVGPREWTAAPRS